MVVEILKDCFSSTEIVEEEDDLCCSCSFDYSSLVCLNLNGPVFDASSNEQAGIDPLMADVAEFWSCPPEHKSYRTNGEKSPFIDSLSRILNTYGDRLSLLDISLLVNSDLKKHADSGSSMRIC